MRGEVWQFLMDLPTYEVMLTNIEAKTTQMNESIWKSFLIDGSVYRAIYCLQVVDFCLVPSTIGLDIMESKKLSNCFWAS